MSISTDVGTQLSVDEIILSACQQCGVLSLHDGYTSPQWNKYATFGRRRLDNIIDTLPLSGVFARALRFYELTLSEGTHKYNLPSYALDVHGNAMYMDSSVTDTSKADSESLVIQKSMEEWHQLSTKSTESEPTLFAVYRYTSPLQVWFWPIPDEAGTVRFQIHTLSADTYDGDANIELRSYWVDYLTFRLAFIFATANSLPPNVCNMMRSEAERQLKLARAFANDHADDQVHVSYGRR